MTRKIAGTCFAALVGFALSAAAQSNPTTPQTPQTPPTSPYPSSQASTMDHGDKKTAKLTGCVQAGTAAGTYELTNIKKAMKDTASASASASTSPSAPATAEAGSRTVKLVAAAGVDLSQHVGHQVEVSGSWNKSGTSASTPSANPDAAASASSSGAKEFNVTDVKMVSATCSAGTN